MRIAVVFDTPYADWTPARQAEQMRREHAAAAKNPDDEPEMEYQVAQALIDSGHEVLLIGVRDDVHDASAQLAGWRPDLVFNATEAFGDNPELDYLIPAMLEAQGYRYTGAPPVALLVTRHKAMSKKILAYHGVKVPGFVTYRVGERPGPTLPLRFPVIVKPMLADGSEGIGRASIVRNVTALARRVAFLHRRFGKPAIAEEYIEGRELYATIVGNGEQLQVLPFVELVFDRGASRPESRIQTRKAKWDLAYRRRRGIRTVYARRLSAAARARLEEVCRIAFRALWLRDYARVDVRITPDGEVWFLEANANPYLSFGHNSAEAAHKAGMYYEAFIQRICDEAMRRDA
ncbi:MAG TPA: ATP-grasp domain-containing protein [Kofleriaceae bacterium]|nr:ATP-grasp domain-containing protein [Kofleriaceae bacterium]